MLPWSYDEDNKQISLIYFTFNNIKCHQISALAIVFLVIFAGMALKLEKIGPFFFEFQFMSTLAINSNRRHEMVSMTKYSVDHYLEFS